MERKLTKSQLATSFALIGASIFAIGLIMIFLLSANNISSNEYNNLKLNGIHYFATITDKTFVNQNSNNEPTYRLSFVFDVGGIIHYSETKGTYTDAEIDEILTTDGKIEIIYDKKTNSSMEAVYHYTSTNIAIFIPLFSFVFAVPVIASFIVPMIANRNKKGTTINNTDVTTTSSNDNDNDIYEYEIKF